MKKHSSSLHPVHQQQDHSCASTLHDYLKHMQFDFARIMDIEQGRDCFEEFAKKTLNTEAILFIKAVDYYHSLRSTENRYREANHIIEEFIKSSANNQINLSEELVKYTLEQYQHCSNMSCTPSLFDSCADAILLQLKQGTFQHFVESTEFLEWIRSLLRHGGRLSMQHLGSWKRVDKEMQEERMSITTVELLEDSSVDCHDQVTDCHTSHSESTNNTIAAQFLHYQKKDFSLKDLNSNLQDVEFVQFACHEATIPFLKPIVMSETYQSYFYKKPMKIGKKYGMLVRAQMELPFDYEKVAHVILSKKYRELSDPNVYEMKLVDCVSANRLQGKLASFVTQEKFKLGFPFTNRYCIISNSLVKNTVKEHYLYTKRSCNYVDKTTGVLLEDSKLTKTWFYGGGMITKLGENKCRVTETLIINFNSVLSFETIAKVGAARIEKLYKTSMTLLKNEFKLNLITIIPKDGDFPLSAIVSENAHVLL